MIFLVFNKKGEIIRMNADLPGFLMCKKEECGEILKTQLKPYFQNHILPLKNKRMIKGQLPIRLRRGKELLIHFDGLIGKEGSEIGNTVFILSSTQERPDITTIKAFLDGWEERIFLTSEKVIILVNQKLADWFGYPPEEFYGRDLADFLQTDNKGRNLVFRSQPIFWQKRLWANLLIAQEEKRREDFAFLNRALSLQRDKLLKLSGELTRVNDELRRLIEAKSEFVSAVSHDLRTPLTTIIEGVSLCAQGLLGEVNPEQKKILDLVLADAKRMAEFINDLLELSRIESGRIEIKKKRLPMNEVISQVLDSFQKLAEEKEIALTNSLPRDLPPTFADERHCRRVLTNLIGNSLKFTPPGGKVEIMGKWRKETDELIFGVKDNGIGIPKKEQEKIFQRFCRIERKGEPLEPGTGLGLALCKELVEINGGKIWFESEEQKGTTFFFSLPVYSDDLELKDAVHWALEKTKSGELPISLLLADFSPRPSEKAWSEILEKSNPILEKEITNYGFFRQLKAKNRLVVFLIVPPERVYENNNLLRNSLKNLFPNFESKVIYRLFAVTETNKDEVLNFVLRGS